MKSCINGVNLLSSYYYLQSYVFKFEIHILCAQALFSYARSQIRYHGIDIFMMVS